MMCIRVVVIGISYSQKLVKKIIRKSRKTNSIGTDFKLYPLKITKDNKCLHNVSVFYECSV